MAAIISMDFNTDLVGQYATTKLTTKPDVMKFFENEYIPWQKITGRNI